MDDAKLVELFRDGEDYDPIFEGRVEGLRAVAAAAWDEACMAFGWALHNGEPISAAHYVASNNPYRPAVLVPAQEDNK